MSSTFSFSRLGKLITKQFFENSRLYIFSALALFGLLALVFAFWIGTGGPRYYEQETYIIFLFGLFTSGAAFAAMSFGMLGSKDKGIYWLSVPATHLEKLICTVFYSTIVFTIVYCICFYTVKSVSVAFIEEYIRKHPGAAYIELNDFEHGFGGAIKYFIYAYFAVHSLYLLGSVYFTRYSFVLTTVIGSAVIFAFGYYINRIHYNMPGEWEVTSLRKNDAGGYLLYSISPAVKNMLKYTVQFAWVPLFWVVTWFRLKEKEI